MLQANTSASFPIQQSNKFRASAGPTVDYRISTKDLVTATGILNGYQKPLQLVIFDENGAVTPLTSRDVHSLKSAGFQPEFSPAPESISQLRML